MTRPVDDRPQVDLIPVPRDAAEARHIARVLHRGELAAGDPLEQTRRIGIHMAAGYRSTPMLDVLLPPLGDEARQ